MSSLVVLIIAIVLGVLVLKFVFGVIKFVLVAAIVIGSLAWLGRKLG